MTEDFNRSYRRLAEAAQEVATEKNRRKRSGFADSKYVEKIGRNPRILLQGTSSELRKEFQDDIAIKALPSFIKTLAGSTDADARHVLNIGNFLHAHRTELKNKDGIPNQPLSAEDRPLMDLACAIIENSFYRGDFLGLSTEQSASLAFTVSVVAKIFEYPESSKGLKGFDTEKLRKFITAVHTFEHQSLFPTTMANAFRASEINGKRKSLYAANPDVPMPIEKTRDLRRTEGYFVEGEERIMRLMGNQNILPYIFKDVLIVRNRIEAGKNGKKQAEIERDLAMRRFPPDWEESIKENRARGIRNLGAHLMLPSNQKTDTEASDINRYANLHFFPDSIPFAVWALRYLRSQAKMKNSPTE